FLRPLDKGALRQILTEPKNALMKQYVELFKIDGIELAFEDEVLDLIVDKAMEFKLGARGLRGICEAIMTDVMFELPGLENKPEKHLITYDYASEKLKTARLNQLKVA
ncbi:MAG: ATP-dependent Clp protease ATP-binding subunit ClpX, partial [Bacteroidia bacterium]